MNSTKPKTMLLFFCTLYPAYINIMDLCYWGIIIPEYHAGKTEDDLMR
jgi:hypothetical protein